ncbi:MAG: hypothetical protein JXA44_11585, partial [Methanospirillaceae archaeon]|nr:hypothetical protein [Methanospirillaceae archaeon]
MPGKEKNVSYIMLSEALSSGRLVIQEVSTGGSVPELSVTNNGDIAVLIMDGEELAGAKQNRVANTSILVPPGKTIIIPVSCTESGRWSYTSEHFADSDVMMSRDVRARKNRSVSENLHSAQSFRSNQRELWTAIDDEISACHVSAPTSAMKDAHEHARESLKRYVDAFPCQPDQQGIIVFLNGIPAGLEYLSCPGCYRQVHEKLIRSYAMEAIRVRNRNSTGNGAGLDTKDNAQGRSEDDAVQEEDVSSFVSAISSAPTTPFPSPGMGEDWRIAGKEVAGSALVCENEVIHMAVFAVPAGDGETRSRNDSGMESMNRRRHRMMEGWDVY